MILHRFDIRLPINPVQALSNRTGFVLAHAWRPRGGLTAPFNPHTLLGHIKPRSASNPLVRLMLPFLLKHILALLRRARGVHAFGPDLHLPGGLFAQLRCARRIDATSRRIAAMGTRIGNLSGRLEQGSIPGAVDADRNLRRMLCELNEDLCAMRRDLALWHVRECRGRAGARLEAAIAQLNRIAVETCTAAERLVREIEEYDEARA
jgi:hypothetical protein